MEHFKYFKAVMNTPSPHPILADHTNFQLKWIIWSCDDVIPQDRQTEIKNGCQR